jgi:hypothetical protein
MEWDTCLAVPLHCRDGVEWQAGAEISKRRPLTGQSA